MYSLLGKLYRELGSNSSIPPLRLTFCCQATACCSRTLIAAGTQICPQGTCRNNAGDEYRLLGNINTFRAQDAVLLVARMLPCTCPGLQVWIPGISLKGGLSLIPHGIPGQPCTCRHKLQAHVQAGRGPRRPPASLQHCRPGGYVNIACIQGSRTRCMQGTNLI